jgi:hypothetical protein
VSTLHGSKRPKASQDDIPAREGSRRIFEDPIQVTGLCRDSERVYGGDWEAAGNDLVGSNGFEQKIGWGR